jgi:hypothetical protein
MLGAAADAAALTIPLAALWVLPVAFIVGRLPRATRRTVRKSGAPKITIVAVALLTALLLSEGTFRSVLLTIGRLIGIGLVFFIVALGVSYCL